MWGLQTVLIRFPVRITGRMTSALDYSLLAVEPSTCPLFSYEMLPLMLCFYAEAASPFQGGFGVFSLSLSLSLWVDGLWFIRVRVWSHISQHMMPAKRLPDDRT